MATLTFTVPVQDAGPDVVRVTTQTILFHP
jgi:hypothetical protein